MQKPIPNLCCIKALHKEFHMPNMVNEWKELNLVAVSSTENFFIAHLGDQPWKMHSKNRHKFIEKDSICYLAWGSGMTPGYWDES